MTDTNENGHIDEDACERYLFGEMNQSEQEEFESLYFENDVFFERFVAVKEDVLDLYSRGELDSSKRARMRPHFLATAPRRRRIEESRDFIDAITAVSDRAIAVEPANNSPAARAAWIKSITQSLTPFRLASAAVVILVAIIGVWLLLISGEATDLATRRPERSNSDQGITLRPDNSNQTPMHDPNQSVSNTLPSQELAINSRPSAKPELEVPNSNKVPEIPTIAKSDPAAPDTNVAALAPTPQPEVAAGSITESVTLDGSARSVSKGNTATIGPDTRSVSMRLRFGGEAYPNYSVSITSIGGAVVWQARNLKAPMTEGPKTLTVSVPANVLTRKDYIVVLNGRTADGKTETIREYYFHVESSRNN